jgi:hypothetical protein
VTVTPGRTIGCNARLLLAYLLFPLFLLLAFLFALRDKPFLIGLPPTNIMLIGSRSGNPPSAQPQWLHAHTRFVKQSVSLLKKKGNAAVILLQNSKKNTAHAV